MNAGRKASAVVSLFLVLMVLLLTLPPGTVLARSKPGPVTIRGIALRVSSSAFDLQTLHAGTYHVLLARATAVTVHGRSGRATIHDGDHVGVHGFLTGRMLRAIDVRIYPVKPKPITVHGTVVSYQGGVLVVQSGKTRYTVRLTSSTSVTGSLHGLVPGARVEFHGIPSGRTVIASHVHVYVTHVTGRHVELRGTVVRVSGAQIVVRVNNAMVNVTLNAATAFHRGTGSGSRADVRPGANVTVYACCQGHPLVATSIHVHVTAVHISTVVVRGRVSARSSTSLQVTGSGTQTITLTTSTAVTIGSATGRPGDVRIGDQVTVRAVRAGSRLVARSVHVLAASRRPRSIRGTVVGVGPGSVIVRDRGRKVTIAVPTGVHVSLNGHGVTVTSLRPGDRVHIVARPGSPLRATSVTATRKAPKLPFVTVRGSIVTVGRGTMTIVAGTGHRYVVRPAQGVIPLLSGKRAPAAALFPGAPVSVRGHVKGAALLATSIRIEVRAGTVKGRVAQVGNGVLIVHTTSGRVEQVIVPAGVVPVDGGRRVGFAAGMYIEAGGFEVRTGVVRAAHITVEHPDIDSAAVLVATAPALQVRTSAGERFVLRLASGVKVMVTRVDVSVSPAEIPVGAHVHVQGTVDARGNLIVTSITVRLPSITARGQVKTLAGRNWTVALPTGSVTVQVSTTTPIAQGEHALQRGDVVVGDDVTVEGYTLRGSNVLARRILVHRRLVGMDGVIETVTAQGFTLQAADGVHPVLTGPDLIVSGTAGSIAPGQTVHVTGYLRGDGVILATRLRFMKSPGH